MMSTRPGPGVIVEDRYQIVRHLADGGMGSVFEARQIEIDRKLVLKFLHSEYLADSDWLQRFQREAKILSRLSHPNIVTFYGYGLHNKTTPYLALEYIEGKSLREVVNQRQRLTPELTISLAIQLCNALDYAHSLGVLHRDLKPNNIMIIDQNNFACKILDFGLAGLIGEGTLADQGLTSTGSLLGTAYYMSPEQCQAVKLDGRADQYSLGCMLYECLQGQPPLIAESMIGLLHLHVNERPRPLTDQSGAEALPDGLANAIFRCMAKDPSERYSSMAHLRADLVLCADGRGNEIIEAAPPEKSMKRRAFYTPLAVATILIAATISLVAVRNHRTSVDMPAVFKDSRGITHSLQGNDVEWPNYVLKDRPLDCFHYILAWINHNRDSRNYAGVMRAYALGLALIGRLESMHALNYKEKSQYLQEACAYFEAHEKDYKASMGVWARNPREVLYWHGSFLVFLDKSAEAEPYFHKAVTASGGASISADLIAVHLAEIFDKTNRSAESIALLNKVLGNGPGLFNPELYCRILESQLKLGQTDEAAITLQNLLTKCNLEETDSFLFAGKEAEQIQPADAPDD